MAAAAQVSEPEAEVTVVWEEAAVEH